MTKLNQAIFHCCCISALIILSGAQQDATTARVKLGYELVAENPEVFKTCIKTDVATCESNALCVKGGKDSEFCLPKFFSSDFQDVLDLKDPATSKLTVCGKNEATTPETCKTSDGCALCGTACFPSKTSDGKDSKLTEVCKARDVNKLISASMLTSDAKALYETCAKSLSTCASNDKCYEALKGKVCIPKNLETESLTTAFIRLFDLTAADKRNLYTDCLTDKTSSDSKCVDCDGAWLPAIAKDSLAVCKELSTKELETVLAHFAANKQLYVSCARSSPCDTSECEEESATKVCLPKFLTTNPLIDKFVETFSLATDAKKDAFEKCLTAKTPFDNSKCINCGGTVGLPAVISKDLKMCKLTGTGGTTVFQSTIPPSTDPDTTTSSSSRTAGEVTVQDLTAFALLALAAF